MINNKQERSNMEESTTPVKQRKQVKREYVIQAALGNNDSHEFEDVAKCKDTAEGLRWIRENGASGEKYRIVIITASVTKQVTQVEKVRLV
jgi:DNA polymerase II large subunit